MKKLHFIVGLVYLFSAFVQAEEKLPLEYLQGMVQAHQTRQYEQLYILQQGENVVSLRYRHAYANKHSYAQLLRLDDLREEIILREGKVSYFGDFQPFSLSMPYILDNLPSVIYVDFHHLTGYHFVDVGRARIANHLARVIRIVPRDDFRYQYQLWIDEENQLLLRSDLLDRNNQVLEQFRVLQSIVDDQLLEIIPPITHLIMPALIETKSSESEEIKWQPKWLPNGFKKVNQIRQRLSEMWIENEEVESQLYSDGLFSFTIYVVKNQGKPLNEQFWREGKTSVYSESVGENDIVIVGEIPLASARHIVQEMALEWKENKQ